MAALENEYRFGSRSCVAAGTITKIMVRFSSPLRMKIIIKLSSVWPLHLLSSDSACVVGGDTKMNPRRNVLVLQKVTI
jgi:hypothetical protein